VEKVKVGFYRIQRCGYYGGPRNSTHKFCQIGDLLRQLHAWSKNKTFAATKIYDQVAEGELLPAYTYSVHRHQQGDYLVTLWNQVASADEGIASVASNEVVGSARVYVNEVKSGTIPGFPSYFWFPVDTQAFANVKLQFPTGGHAQLQAYLQAFLERASSDHVVYDSGNLNTKIVGYRQQSSDEPANFFPKFRSFALRQQGLHDHILANALHISRVRYRTLLDPSSAEDRQWWQSMWRLISPGSSTPVQAGPIKFEYELKTGVTPEEVRAIIAHASETEDDSWSDVGFDMRGKNSTFWLSKSYARGEFDLDVNRGSYVIVDGSSLLDALVARRVELLSLMQDGQWSHPQSVPPP